MSTSSVLREIFTAGRPLVGQWLDIAEQMAALRDVATAKGLDWSQVKALLKAQIQDERDEAGDGKRVRRIVEKAEFASAYADMLGLGNMNENNFSAEEFDPETGEIQSDEPQEGGRDDRASIANSNLSAPDPSPEQTDKAGEVDPPASPAPIPEPFEPPAFLQRERKPLREHCRHPDNLELCGGYGTKHCYPCLQAAGKTEVAA